jgi:hypothetical protein
MKEKGSSRLETGGSIVVEFDAVKNSRFLTKLFFCDRKHKLDCCMLLSLTGYS